MAGIEGEQEEPGQTFFDTNIVEDPGMQKLALDYEIYNSPENQTSLFETEIKQLAAGVGEDDTQLIDTKRLIDGGTEDIVRQEIQKSGGIGTTAQIRGL